MAKMEMDAITEMDAGTPEEIEPVYIIPEDAERNSKESEKTEMQTAETKLLQDINGKLDLLLAAQQIDV